MARYQANLRRYGRVIRRGVRGAMRAAPAAASAVDMMLKMRRGRASAGTMTTKRGPDTGFTSRQHDMRMQYVKRRMPAAKRRRWVSFVKKVNAVSDNDRGVTTIVFNRRALVAQASLVSGFRRQSVAETHIYGFAGTDAYDGLNRAVVGSDDLLYIFSQDPLLGIGAEATTRKIRLHSAVMDVTVRNPTDSIIELDCYEIAYYRSAPGSTTSLINTMEVAQQSAEAVNTSSGFRTVVSDLSLRGVTPFEMGAGISTAKMKILKKTKYFVDPGAVITRQFRDPKNRFLDDSYVQRRTGFVMPGFTKTLLWIAKRQTTVSEQVTVGIEIGCTTTYKYTVEGQSRDRTQYVTN